MTFRMRLYGGSPYRVLRASEELVSGRRAHVPAAPPSTEPILGSLDISTVEDPLRTFRCQVALASEPARHEDESGSSYEHLGRLAFEQAPEPNESRGPGVVLFTEDAQVPEPRTIPNPAELFGPCLLLVPSGRQHRGLHGVYLMLSAPEGTRDRVSDGHLPEPSHFRFAAFLGDQHRFATADPIPFIIRAGIVTAIVEQPTGSPVTRPELL